MQKQYYNKFNKDFKNAPHQKKKKNLKKQTKFNRPRNKKRNIFGTGWISFPERVKLLGRRVRPRK